MKSFKNFLIIALFFSGSKAFSCSCMGLEDFYDLFKNDKLAFVGKVIHISPGPGLYTFEVLDKLNSNLSGTITVINNRPEAAGCSAYLELGKIYLISPYKFKDRYQVGKCSFYKSSGDKTFKEDTMLFKLFRKKDFVVHSRYFKGEMKNGKRNGNWVYYFNDSITVDKSGYYKKDKEFGKWEDGRDTVWYNRGKFQKRVSIIDDSLNLKCVQTKNEVVVYYENGNIFKTYSNRKYKVYSPSGKLKETVQTDKSGYMIGTWVLYNEDGTIKDSYKINEEETSFSVYDYMYFSREETSFKDYPR
jgi:hypothetical protein